MTSATGTRHGARGQRPSGRSQSSLGGRSLGRRLKSKVWSGRAPREQAQLCTPATLPIPALRPTPARRPSDPFASSRGMSLVGGDCAFAVGPLPLPIEAFKAAVRNGSTTSRRDVQLLTNVTHRLELMPPKFVSGTAAPGAWRGRKNDPGIPTCSGYPDRCGLFVEPLARPCLSARRDGGVRDLRREAGVAEAVDDRIAPVAAEILRADLDPRRRLAALVLGEIEELFDPLHRLRVITLGNDVGDPHLLLDQPV